MRVTINDDFSLKKIAASGQCFRVREFEDGTFRFITGQKVLYIKPLNEREAPGTYEISCSKDEWDSVWYQYFDLETEYAAIRKQAAQDGEAPGGQVLLLARAAREGAGIRILRQEPWEMLISFIISQRKSIPAIRSCIGQLCENFGAPIVTARETVYAFPSAKALVAASAEKLADCGLGYRLPYVIDAASRVVSGSLEPEALVALSDAELFETLKSVKGVGDKVANCVCLFAYHRTGLAPVDVWIRRIIDSEYGGINPFPAFKEMAGILQQYLFFYAQNHKSEF